MLFSLDAMLAKHPEGGSLVYPSNSPQRMTARQRIEASRRRREQQPVKPSASPLRVLYPITGSAWMRHTHHLGFLWTLRACAPTWGSCLQGPTFARILPQLTTRRNSCLRPPILMMRMFCRSAYTISRLRRLVCVRSRHTREMRHGFSGAGSSNGHTPLSYWMLGAASPLEE